MYECVLIGWKDDGKTIARFHSEALAIKYAEVFWEKHADELDDCWSGVAVFDPSGEPVIW